MSLLAVSVYLLKQDVQRVVLATVTIERVKAQVVRSTLTRKPAEPAPAAVFSRTFLSQLVLEEAHASTRTH